MRQFGQLTKVLLKYYNSFVMRAFPAIMYVSLKNIIRQPFFLFIVVGGCIFIIFLPVFTMFTLMNVKEFALDMGMATILLIQLVTSVLATSLVVAGDVEEKTTTLLLSKPISRLSFLLGKFCAVSLALFFVFLLLTSVLIMSLSMVIPEAAYWIEYSVLWFQFLPLVGAAIISAGANYYADRHFASTFVVSTIILFLLSLFILYSLEGDLLMMSLFYPALFLWMAGVLISPIASLLSVGGRVFFALIFSFLIFVLGLAANYLLGNLLHIPVIRFIYSFIPNFQVFWIEDAWKRGEVISISYLWNVVRYVILYCGAMLLLGWGIWERREISSGR